VSKQQRAKTVMKVTSLGLVTYFVVICIVGSCIQSEVLLDTTTSFTPFDSLSDRMDSYFHETYTIVDNSFFDIMAQNSLLIMTILIVIMIIIIAIVVSRVKVK
jgi:hypothetical protein